MIGLVYLAALVVAGGCLLLVDRRWRLFFWRAPWIAALVTVSGTVFFLAWDVAGIASGIFFRGGGAIATGILLAPELPIEEPVFLAFLVLCTMVLYTGAARLVDARRERRAERRARRP